MSKVNGIYAATLSILNDDLSLNLENINSLVFLSMTGKQIFMDKFWQILIIFNGEISDFIGVYIAIDNIIGTGLNSLSDTINLMKISQTNKLKDFW